MYLIRSHGLVNLHVLLGDLKPDLLQQVVSTSFFWSQPLSSAALVRWLGNSLMKIETKKELNALAFSMSQVTSFPISFGEDAHFLYHPCAYRNNRNHLPSLRKEPWRSSNLLSPSVDISKDGAFATSLGSLFQYLITLMVKNFLYWTQYSWWGVTMAEESSRVTSLGCYFDTDQDTVGFLGCEHTLLSSFLSRRTLSWQGCSHWVCLPVCVHVLPWSKCSTLHLVLLNFSVLMDLLLKFVQFPLYGKAFFVVLDAPGQIWYYQCFSFPNLISECSDNLSLFFLGRPCFHPL